MPGRSWKGHAAKVCERCGASLVLVARCDCAEKPAAALLPASERFLAVEGVSAHFGERVLAGSLVIRDEGLFLFIERCEEKPSLVPSLLHAAVDRVAGLAGGFLMKALEAGEAPASPPPGARPREEYQAVYDRALHEAPAILRSRWCLPLSKRAISTACFRGSGLLELAVAGQAVELWAEFARRGAAAFMESAGYPVERRAPAVGKKLALVTVAVIGALAIVRELADFQEAADWAGPKVGAAAAAAVDAKGTISLVKRRDGKRFYEVDGREVPEAELSWGAKAWFHWREVILLVLFGGAAGCAALWAAAKFL